MMRKALVAITVTLAAAAAVVGQDTADEARKELDLGTRAYRNSRFEEAERRFRRALELDPDGKNTRIFIARSAQQQYRPGVQTPENIAVGERAVAAYQEVLAGDSANDDAYKSVLYLYGQMKNDEKVQEVLLQRANDFSIPSDKRAEAFSILASRKWNCAYQITERKESKTTEQKENKAVVRYKMPADPSDFMRARQCVTEGLQLAEQAASLTPDNPNAWSYKANLMREAAKLAEMEGNEAQKAEYDRQYLEAREAWTRLAPEGAKPTEDHIAPAAAGADTPEVKGKGVVTGGVLNGKAVSKPQPAYPPIAKAAGASGTVTVQIVVDEEGNVISASAVSGHPLLQQAAVAAARQAKFSPTFLSGQAVKISGVLTYNFVLE